MWEYSLWYGVIYDSHVLHLRSETVAVRGRMNMVLDEYYGQMITEDEYGLHFLTLVLQFIKVPENFKLEIDSTGD